MSARHRQSYELNQIRICQKKVRYDTLAQAAEGQKHVWDNDKLRLVIYVCPHGEDHFHLSKELRDPAIKQFRIMRDRAMREQKCTVPGMRLS